MSRTIRNFVNGESVDSVSGQTSDLVNPTTGEVFAQAVVSNAEDVDRAYRAASDAFESWSQTTPSAAAGRPVEDRRHRRGER